LAAFSMARCALSVISLRVGGPAHFRNSGAGARVASLVGRKVLGRETGRERTIGGGGEGREARDSRGLAQLPLLLAPRGRPGHVVEQRRCATSLLAAVPLRHGLLGR
jgi:hypothetical protein